MINLLPPDIKQEIIFARKNVMLVQYCVLAGIVGLALVAILFFGLTIMSNDERLIKKAITEREATLASLKSSEDEAQELASQITTIGSLLNTELNYSDVIVQIGSLIPEGATLQNLDLQQTIKTDPLSLTVLVDTQAKAAVLQQNFENSPLFAGADIQTIAPSERTEDGGVLNYTVSMIVSYAGKEEEKE